MIRFALALLLIWPGVALAWGHHYLLTDRALQHPIEKDLVGQQVQVETLEDFLKAEGPGLAKVIAEDYDWLDANGVPGRHLRQTYDPSTPTAIAFFEALRLNPATQVPYVMRPLPTDPPPVDTLPLDQVSTYLYVTPHLRFDFEPAPPGSDLTVGEILRTYSDEPDWGIDFELWSHPEYGYGVEPYGKPTGQASKAAFHMKFAHEPWLVRHFVAGITDGMPVERIETFTRLARFAFATHHDYWGWRFTAWAIHYAQDLAQPYHSRALPGEGNGYYLRYIFSFHKAEMKAEATQLAQNRHYIFEDFAAYGLQQSYVEDTRLFGDLASFLSNGDALLPSAHDATSLADAVMASAAAQAPTLDATIVKAFGPHLTEDTSFNIEKAPDYDIVKVLKDVPPEQAQQLLGEAGKDFQLTGEATRSVIALVKPTELSARAPAPVPAPAASD